MLWTPLTNTTDYTSRRWSKRDEEAPTLKCSCRESRELLALSRTNKLAERTAKGMWTPFIWSKACSQYQQGQPMHSRRCQTSQEDTLTKKSHKSPIRSRLSPSGRTSSIQELRTVTKIAWLNFKPSIVTKTPFLPRWPTRRQRRRSRCSSQKNLPTKSFRMKQRKCSQWTRVSS